MNKKKRSIKKNEFFGINKLPNGQGITVVGISMPLIGNRQSPKECIKSTNHIIPKIKESGVGAVILYTDSLYLNSNEKASILKTKFQKVIEDHKRGYLKLIKRNVNIIPKAFSFTTWGQILLDCPDFTDYFKELKKIYSKDKIFQKYVKEDIIITGRRVNDNHVNYILEEVLLDYLMTKGKVRLQNDFVGDRQGWILNSYHGKPHKSHAYLYQKNFFKLKSNNQFENCWYDLNAKILYDFNNLDIDSFDFSK